jgi:hypothetical protein
MVGLRDPEAALRGAAQHMIDYFGANAVAEAEKRAERHLHQRNIEAHAYWMKVLSIIRSLQEPQTTSGVACP